MMAKHDLILIVAGFVLVSITIIKFQLSQETIFLIGTLVGFIGIGYGALSTRRYGKFDSVYQE